jgi:hypothetical protein
MKNPDVACLRLMDGGAQRRREIAARLAVRVTKQDQPADFAVFLKAKRTHFLPPSPS